MKIASLKSILLMVLLSIGSSCGSSDEGGGDEGTVDNGQLSGANDCNEGNSLNLVNGALTSEYEEIGRLVIDDGINDETGLARTRVCTGTAVGHNTFVTAHHCLPNIDSENRRPPEKISYVRGNTLDLEWTQTERNAILADASVSTQATKVIYSPDEPGSSLDDTGSPVIEIQTLYKDLAVIIFPNNTFSKFLPVANRDPLKGEKVNLVGFGDTELPSDGELTMSERKIGGNFVTSVSKEYSPVDGAILVSGYVADNSDPIAKSEFSLGSKGDSGGPLIIEGALGGVLSIGSSFALTDPERTFTKGMKGDGLNFYASLQSKHAQDLLEEASNQGATFTIKTISEAPNDCDD